MYSLSVMNRAVSAITHAHITSLNYSLKATQQFIAYNLNTVVFKQWQFHTSALSANFNALHLLAVLFRQVCACIHSLVLISAVT